MKEQSEDAEIAKILGLMEEKERSKEWLLGEIKHHKIRLQVPLTANSYEILKSCNSQTIHHILHILNDDEFAIKDIKTQTQTLHWFFTDIVGSSDPSISVKAQARKISLLNWLIQNSETFRKREQESTAILSTGDGMAIGFPDNPEMPLKLAIEMHKQLNRYNKSKPNKDKVYVRIGIDSGPVYFIKGIAESKIFWGPGIIMARRVMDLCGPNQIFASSRIADDLRKLSAENKATMQPIGSFSVKHGIELQIYNIIGHGFGNKLKPKKQKREEDTDDKTGFEFKSISVILDVTDPKSMMTHHTWVWDVRNTSDTPLVHIFYDIGGDIPKNFADMNVKIKDNNNNQLEIISLDVNRPVEKKFYVKLNRPLKKDHSVRLSLEYDWEEPERVFEYAFSSRCHKFKYDFSIPKGIEIRNRVLEVVREIGIKKRVEQAPSVKYLDDKTVISWESDKNRVIKPHEAFEFQW